MIRLWPVLFLIARGNGFTNVQLRTRNPAVEKQEADTLRLSWPSARVRHQTLQSTASSKISSLASSLGSRFVKALWKGATIPFPALRQAVLGDSEEISISFRFRESMTALLLYFAFGAGCYHYFEPSWTLVDSIYFTVTCFTTVGYGDLCPTTVGSKVFTCFFGVSGICMLGAAVAAVSSKVIQKEVEAIKAAKDESTAAIKAIFQDNDEPATKNKSVTSSNERKKASKLRKVGKFLGHVLPPLALVLGGGVYIYNLNHPGPDPVVSWNALYYAIVTASTIGFGDIHPSTRAARICAIFYIPVAVAAAGELLSSVANRIMTKRKELATEQRANKGLTLDSLLEMDANGDGKVSESEYVQHMLVEMGLVESKDIDFLKNQFDRLDMDKSGYLDRNDLRAKAVQKGVFETE